MSARSNLAVHLPLEATSSASSIPLDCLSSRFLEGMISLYGRMLDVIYPRDHTALSEVLSLTVI